MFVECTQWCVALSQFLVFQPTKSAFFSGAKALNSETKRKEEIKTKLFYAYNQQKKRTEKEIIKWIKLVCRFCQKTFSFRCLYTPNAQMVEKKNNKRLKC